MNNSSGFASVPNAPFLIEKTNKRFGSSALLSKYLCFPNLQRWKGNVLCLQLVRIWFMVGG